MATTHYAMSRANAVSQEAWDTINGLAAAWDKFVRLRGVMVQTKDAAASGSAVYAAIAAAYGFADAASAQAAFTQIDTAFAGDAAIQQMVNQIR
jgi:hypothetical protein